MGSATRHRVCNLVSSAVGYSMQCKSIFVSELAVEVAISPSINVI